MIEIHALPDLPEVASGDDLAELLERAATPIGGLEPGDVLVVAHKVVSKAEGRLVRLADVEPGEQARALAAHLGKTPELVEVVLGEAAEILRADAGRLIVRTHHGFVCANAGVDQSNAPPGHAVLLPADPDASARRLHERLGCAVVISDSFGRPWRVGQTEVAIGCAGVAAIEDWRGRPDAMGRPLHATAIAVADELAAAADLARRKDSREPAVRIRGFTRDGQGRAADLVRPVGQDLFR